MHMNKYEMIDLFKKLMKGEVKTVKCYEPTFDLVEREAQFDYSENSIIVTIWSSVNNVKETKEIVADRGLALCFFKQAIWYAKEVKAWDEDNVKTIWTEEELRK